jgi:hypothetical protein
MTIDSRYLKPNSKSISPTFLYGPTLDHCFIRVHKIAALSPYKAAERPHTNQVKTRFLFQRRRKSDAKGQDSRVAEESNDIAPFLTERNIYTSYSNRRSPIPRGNGRFDEPIPIKGKNVPLIRKAKHQSNVPYISVTKKVVNSRSYSNLTNKHLTNIKNNILGKIYLFQRRLNYKNTSANKDSLLTLKTVSDYKVKIKRPLMSEDNSISPWKNE